MKGNKVEIGRIDLMKNFSFVEVAEADADRVVKGLKHGVTVKGRSVVADYADRGEKGNAPSAPKARKKDRAEKPAQEKSSKKKPSREERGYTSPRGKKYAKEDWLAFLNPDMKKNKGGDEEGWARRKPKKK